MSPRKREFRGNNPIPSASNELMWKIGLFILVVLNLLVIGLCVYEHRCLRLIAHDFSKLTTSLHGPLDEVEHFPQPATMEELRLHYERTIAARWGLMNRFMSNHTALEEVAGIHKVVALLFVTLSTMFVILNYRTRKVLGHSGD